MADYDETEIGCGDRGEIVVTDEQLSGNYVVAIGVYEGKGYEPSGGYIELTVDEAVRLRNELSRRIETRGPVIARQLIEDLARPVHLHGRRACREVHLFG